jgi:hypothetical protein
MAWGFQNATPKTLPSHKPVEQLQQEASVVLAQGGGFQVYYVPTRSGYIDQRNIDTMAGLGKFCRARQSLSHKSESVPQIGVLFSGTSVYATANRLFGSWGSVVDPARGMLDALVDNGYSVDVIPDWKFEEMAPKYPLLVVPEWPAIGPRIQAAIAARVKGGGKTIVVGAENAALFEELLGVRRVDKPGDQPSYVLGEKIFGQAKGVWQSVEAAGAEVIEYRYPTWDTTRDAKIAATLRGPVVGIYGALGAMYVASHTAALRQFAGRVVKRLFQPAVTVEGAKAIEVALRKKDGLTLIHLVNCAGMQVAAEYMSGDYIPPTGPLTVSLRLAAKPRAVTLYPEKRPLQGTYANGVWRGTVPRLEIHAIVAFA